MSEVQAEATTEVTKPLPTPSKGSIVALWNEGASLDTILASLKLLGITKRSGAELSKKFLKNKINSFLADGSIKKRPVVQDKKS